jgi:YHS domain-containing protein
VRRRTTDATPSRIPAIGAFSLQLAKYKYVMIRFETLACGTLSALDMYPTKSQRITATLGARSSRLFSGALMAATLSFAVNTSVGAAELEGQGIEKIPPLPEVPPVTLGTDTPLLAQADAAPKKGHKRPKVNVDEKGVILKGYDAVAYFKQGKAVKGDPKYSSTYGGATYYFASADDKGEFDKSPAKYKPQYGGYCADAMKKGLLHDIDPNQFLVYKGKLYVCTGAEQIKDFESTPDVNIKKADKKWEYYQPHEIPDYLGG